jgi:hypothetical protein
MKSREASTHEPRMPKRAAASQAATPEVGAKGPKQAKSAAAAAGVHITSSKACQAFARTANNLSALIRKESPGVSITVDEQKKLGSKPDKGSFVVEANGTKVVEMVALARPFTRMKELDLQAVAKKVAALLR